MSILTVIVHHKGRQLLGRCLQSLLESSGVDIRVVLVLNDCREDLPSEAASPRVLIVRTERPLGFGAANNHGVALARETLGSPDLWLFLNNDTVVEEGAVQAMVEALEENVTADIVGPRIMILGASDHLNSLGINLTRTGEAWDEGIGCPLGETRAMGGVRPVVAVTGCALMIRDRALGALAGWSEVYGYYYEDIDLCLRSRSSGGMVLNVPKAVIYHALSATAGVRSDFKLFHMWRNRLILLAVHWPFPLLARVLPRLLAGEVLQHWRRHRAGARRDAALQLRAWGSFARVLPSLLSLRRRATGSRDWVEMLRPAGSVPEIQVPPTATEERT